MESYFERRSQQYYQTGQLQDEYPEFYFQIGIGKENAGKPNYDPTSINHLLDQPQIIERDPKWRFFWPCKEDQIYDIVPCIPRDFPGFYQIMTNWQNQMLQTLYKVSRILALTFDEKFDYFENNLKSCTQYLAPIGCDLKRHKLGTRFSGYHYDLNFLTLHAPSRFPGLFAWLPNGERVEISIPKNHIFVQLGMQSEFITGGVLKAGYHEALYKEENKTDKDWRVTSTLFATLSKNTILQPLKKFENISVGNYGPISVENQFKKELEKLNYY